MTPWAVPLLLMCLPLLTSAFTDAEKQVLVDEHNKHRAQTDPPAANMRKVMYDEGLANTAQSWAGQCIFGHNPNRGWKGENIYVISGDPNINLPAGVQAWDNEKVDFFFKNNSCKPQPVMCGHYTQVVWADTQKLGCGLKHCDNGLKGFSFSGSMNILVCNYSPPGNVQGQSPYMAGTPCSQCPSGTTCQGGLCADLEEENSTDTAEAASRLAPNTTELAPTSELALGTTELSADTPSDTTSVLQLDISTTATELDATSATSVPELSTPEAVPGTSVPPPGPTTASPTLPDVSDSPPLPDLSTTSPGPTTASAILPDVSDSPPLLDLSTPPPMPDLSTPPPMRDVSTPLPPPDISTPPPMPDLSTPPPLPDVSTAPPLPDVSTPPLLPGTLTPPPVPGMSTSLALPDISTVPTTTKLGQILDITPSNVENLAIGSPQTPDDSSLQPVTHPGNGGGSTLSPTASLDQGVGQPISTDPTVEAHSTEILGAAQATKGSGESRSTNAPAISPMPLGDSPANDGPDIGGEVTTLAAIGSPPASSKKQFEDDSALVNKDQPKDLPVLAATKTPTLKSLLSPPTPSTKADKGQKDGKRQPPYPDSKKVKEAQKVDKEKHKNKQNFNFISKANQLKPSYLPKSVGWGFKSAASEPAYFGKPLYSPSSGHIRRAFCPYPCLKSPLVLPLYRTNYISPWGGQSQQTWPAKWPSTNKPWKFSSGHKRAIYSLYLPGRNMEENLIEPNS